MRYMIRNSVIQIVGGMWMPYGATAATEIAVTDNDIRNMRDDSGQIHP